MIAIIPARGGSKGLPGKNIRPLNGKPLIAYAIEAALKSKKISKVIVTTDSEEIAEVAEKFGAEVPFLRPAYLARDNSTAIDVYLHAFRFAKDNYKLNENKFMVLLPTSPLRDTDDINNAIDLFEKENADTLVSVKEAETPPGWYLTKNEADRIKNAKLEKNSIMNNRQINSTYYIPNGAIYILDFDILEEKRTYYTENTVPYIMNNEKSIDIDSIIDFEFAEFMVTKKNHQF